MEENVRVCKVCNVEHPISMFRRVAGGKRVTVCNKCQAAKAKETRKKRRGGGEIATLFRPRPRREATPRSHRANVEGKEVA